MMFALFVGSAAMISLLAVSISLFGLAGRTLRWMNGSNALGYARAPLVFDLAISALWIILALTSCVWGWALLYLVLGLFDRLEPALYFSITSFTTVGYGDVVLEPGWRLLAGMTAAHGLLTFGLFTAFLVEIFDISTRGKAD